MQLHWMHLLLLGLAALAAANDRERIVGGYDAKPGQFPYMASLRVRNKHVCGGAIVSPYHILSAAHCVEAANSRGKLNEVTVVTGSIYLDRGGDIHAVTSMSYDPRYKNDPDKDVAVITLTRPISYNQYQQPITINFNKPPEETFATISGWGLTKYPSSSLPNQLQYQYIKIIKFRDCRYYYPTITTSICTNNGPNVGVCSGDSGSPLVYGGKAVAVASRAVLCAKGYPDLFSSTADSADYLRRELPTLIDSY